MCMSFSTPGAIFSGLTVHPHRERHANVERTAPAGDFPALAVVDRDRGERAPASEPRLSGLRGPGPYPSASIEAFEGPRKAPLERRVGDLFSCQFECL